MNDESVDTTSAAAEVIQSLIDGVEGPVLPQVELSYEADLKLLWVTIRPTPKPVFTLGLLESLTAVQRAVGDMAVRSSVDCPVKFLAFRGDGPFFTLGGDLDFYFSCIECNDRAALLAYAEISIEGCARNMSALGGTVITLANINAKAIGGGIEAPSSCNVLIAEEQASFVYPEVKFNHFPIASVPVLSRRIGERKTAEMLLSGDEVSAAEFYAMGGLEAVVGTGLGDDWIRSYCRQTLPIHAARTAIHWALFRQASNIEAELASCAQAWADHMLSLSDAEVDKLRRISQSQDRMLARLARPARAAAPEAVEPA